MWTAPLRAERFEVGKTITVDIEDDMGPMQLNIGMREVTREYHKVEEKIAEDKLDEYIEKNPGEVVVGPSRDGKGTILYLIDGHHSARAIVMAGKRKMKVKVLLDFSAMNLSWDDFKLEMVRRGLCFLGDENGIKHEFDERPKKISQLGDDPYRSLAGEVRRNKGFKRNFEVRFQEFFWADFFRTRIPRSLLTTEAGWQTALGKALQIVHEPEAASLPGWTADFTTPTCAAVKSNLPGN